MVEAGAESVMVDAGMVHKLQDVTTEVATSVTVLAWQPDEEPHPLSLLPLDPQPLSEPQDPPHPLFH